MLAQMLQISILYQRSTYTKWKLSDPRTETIPLVIGNVLDFAQDMEIRSRGVRTKRLFCETGVIFRAKTRSIKLALLVAVI